MPASCATGRRSRARSPRRAPISTSWKRARDFPALLWGFVDGEPKVNRFRTTKQVPAETPVSRAMSKELAGRGFKFVGPTIVYAFMQATGMVNDHLVDCYRHEHLAERKK